VHDIHRFASKADLLREVARGKTVLHLGAVGETLASPSERAAASPHSVHAQLTAIASRCIGVDINQEAVDAIRSAGIFDNIVVADATTMDRSDIDLPSIDVIVASDVIEHLPNPGILLEAARRVADSHTKIVVTTPNAASLPQFLRYVSGRVIEGDDHKVSFNVYSLKNLLRTAGWEPDWMATCYQRQAAARLGKSFGLTKAALARVPSLGGTLFVISRKATFPQ
jgi:SAM-dependent methyltransferase